MCTIYSAYPTPSLRTGDLAGGLPAGPSEARCKLELPGSALDVNTNGNGRCRLDRHSDDYAFRRIPIECDDPSATDEHRTRFRTHV